MCRNIKTLRRLEQPPTKDELHAAALQYVRKVSGYRMPSRRNQVAFEQAVEEIALVTQKMLDSLVSTHPRVSGSNAMKGE